MRNIGNPSLCIILIFGYQNGQWERMEALSRAGLLWWHIHALRKISCFLHIDIILPNKTEILKAGQPFG